MAACAYCKSRKGKRTCPALSGVVCTQCCGEHRLKEIACPLTCSWLGGAAVLKLAETQGAGDATADATASAIEPAIGKAVEFAVAPAHRDYARDAFQIFFEGDTEPDGTFEPAFIGWLLHAYRPAATEAAPAPDTLLERFLRDKGARLPRAEAAVLLALREGYFSVWDVERTDPATNTMHLRDLFTGETAEVVEPDGAREFGRGHIVSGWALQVRGKLHMAGLPIPIPSEARARLASDMKAELESLCAERAGEARERVLSAHAHRVFHHVFAALRAADASAAAAESATAG